MGTVTVTLDRETMPHNNAELVEYLTTMACVHPDNGTRRMPTKLDDKVFDAAAKEIKRLERIVEDVSRELDDNEEEACQVETDLLKAQKQIEHLKAALLKQAEQAEFLLRLSANERIYLVQPDGKRVRKSLREVLKSELTASEKAAREAIDQKF